VKDRRSRPVVLEDASARVVVVYPHDVLLLLLLPLLPLLMLPLRRLVLLLMLLLLDTRRC